AGLERERQDRLAMELRARLEAERDALNSLADFRRVQNDLVLLERLRPGDSMLKDLRWQLEQIFLSGFDESMAKQRWQEAEDLLVDFARFFDIPTVLAQRARLSEAEKAHDFRMPATQSRRSLLAVRAQTISELLRQPLLTPEWEAQFETAFKESLAMVGAEASGVQLISRTMMLLYRDRAEEAVKAKQYVQARNLIGKGRAYLPDAPELDQVERLLVDAQQTVLRKQEYARQDERLAAAKTALLAHAASGRPDEAAQALEQLRANLPAGDTFIANTAQPAVAEAYLESAGKSRAAGDLDAALAQLERALVVSPTPEIQRTLTRYRDERTHTTLTASLSRALYADTPLDVAKLQSGISDHARRYPEEHEGLMAELVTLATATLVAQTRETPLDGDRLRDDLSAVRSLFPELSDALEREVATALEHHAASLASNDPYRAYNYVASALLALPGNRTLSKLSAQLPPREIARVRSHMDAGRLTAAQKALKAARTRYPDHGEIPKLAAELDERKAHARRSYEIYVSGVNKRKLSRASQRRAAFTSVRRLWSDNPELRRVKYREPRAGECAAELAGRGRESDGVCYDLLAGGDRAVPMVVVPGAENLDDAFAIGKYETSIAEFNTFCEQSGQCRPLTGRDTQLPVTEVPRTAAERYARWLSEQASSSNGYRVVYRLPTDREWQHAADAGGIRATKGINCRPSG
ncbi:MAG: SUMF1/EgtB/PvdO family nonheme iron enzyme, partial [Gammaproteobacteria bacterium]